MKVFKGCFWVGALGLLTGAVMGAEKAPNIVYILADDMGYGDVKALNPKCAFPTPHLDSMASKGMVFTDAHTNSSCCTPTRYGVMTGRYAFRTRLKSGVLNGYGNLLIDKERTTIASLLQQQGYHTACVGKWHIGLDWPSTDGKSAASSTSPNCDYQSDITGSPIDVGFNYFYGLAGSLGMPPHGYVENRRLLGELGERFEGKSKTPGDPLFQCRKGQATKGFNVYKVLEQITVKAVDYIDQRAKQDEPFFLYFSLNSPHAPVAPRKDYAGKSGINPYADFVMETDWAVGRILETLRKHKIEENTMVVFVTDNGCSQTAGFEKLSAAGHRPGYIYRGLKGALYEGGHRVPHLVQWPAKVKAGSVCNETVCTTDFLATLADLHGQKLNDNEGEDSVSFFPALQGEVIPSGQREGVVHHSSDGNFAIRKGDWKLILHPGNGMAKPKTTKDMPPVENPGKIQLFNLKVDPSEKVNVQGQHPELVKELRETLATIIQRGRSTAGEPQKNTSGKKGWPHVEWMKQ